MPLGSAKAYPRRSHGRWGGSDRPGGPGGVGAVGPSSATRCPYSVAARRTAQLTYLAVGLNDGAGNVHRIEPRGFDQPFESTGEPGGVRVRNQVVTADTDGRRCGVGQMIEQRQLFIDHVGAVSAAAAQVDDRIGPPVMQRRVGETPSRDRCSKLRCPAPSSRPGRPTVADDGHPRPLRGFARRVHASAVRSGRWSLTPSGSCR